IISIFTLISRLLGLIRDMVIAHVFGAKLAADAFFVAFRIPNLFRRLFAEGAMTVSFVPIFSESLNRSREEAKETAETLFSLMLVVLTLVSFLGVLFSPLIVRLIAYGFLDNPQKFDLTVFLTRLMFPYLILVSLAAIGMGILNSVKHFAAPAAGPILMNIGVIIGALFFIHWVDPPVVGLAIGVLLGGILQLMVQIPFLKREGFFPRWRWNLKHPSVNKLGKMMLPSAYGAAVYQFNVILITLLASFLASGSVSYLWYADRVMEFPLGVFSIALATAILPTLSDFAARKELQQLKATFNYGLRLIFFVTIPASCGLIVLAGPIVRLLYEHGNFGVEEAAATQSALQLFALGLPFISGVRMTSNAFYSMQDAKTPVRAANLSVICNLLFCLLFLKPWGHNGLALAVSLSSVFNFVLHIVHFRKKVGLIGFRSILSSLIRQLLASGVMSLVLFFILAHWPQAVGAHSVWRQMPFLLGLIAVGVAVYFLLSWILRSREVGELFSMIHKRAAS
ncbi:MAG: murein biosynthesis integral membrane protein MurJ, partial [bacterium]|nr:murein biosynthesis integral membrane protein MurJ [bacterium]